MKKYNNFILEDKYSEQTIELSKQYRKSYVELTLDDAVEHCIMYCQDFINNPKSIRRFMANQTNFFISDPIKRQSRDNSNYYTLMIDNSIYWKDYPKRSKSFICSLNVYNNPNYFVIPEDDSLWGICNEQDIYYGFEKSNIHNICYFFDDLNRLSDYLFDLKISDNSHQEMKRDINLFQEKLYQKYTKKEFEDFILTTDYLKIVNGVALDYAFDSGRSVPNFLINHWDKNIFNTISKTITPDKNDFKLKYYNDLPSSDVATSRNLEIWSESPCLFIHKEGFDIFLELLSKETGKTINVL